MQINEGGEIDNILLQHIIIHFKSLEMSRDFSTT